MFCYRITEKKHPHYPYPTPSAQNSDKLVAALPFAVDSMTNDGIVPTLSQIWGDVLGIVNADHLDIVGQFQHVYEGQQYSTWMMSGSAFDQDRFNSIWHQVSEVITREHQKQD